MRAQHEAVITVVAALLALFTAMINPWISLAMAATMLVLFSVSNWCAIKRAARTE